jgi:hypothetical protein
MLLLLSDNWLKQVREFGDENIKMILGFIINIIIVITYYRNYYDYANKSRK